MTSRSERAPAPGTDSARIEPAAGDPGRFRIEGELDFASVPALHQHATGLFEGCPKIDLDLSGVRRANSAGLALLIEWQGRARRAGLPFSLANLPPGLVNLARISELDQVLPLDRAARGAAAH